MSQVAPAVACVPSVPKFSTVMARFAGGLACVATLGLVTAIASLADAQTQIDRATLDTAQPASVAVAQGSMSPSTAGN